jgi:hypothetical protein
MIGRMVVASLAVAVLVHGVALPVSAQNPFAVFKFRVTLVVNTGAKPVETDAILRLEPEQLVIRSTTREADLKVIPYTGIILAEYSYSSGPPWTSGADPADSGAILRFFASGKKHWLAIHVDGDYALLRLHGSSYKDILPAFEARSGVSIERPQKNTDLL